jgi:hypothetical protein
VYELIPYVRETFRRHLSRKQAVMLVEFDKLKRVREFRDPSFLHPFASCASLADIALHLAIFLFASAAGLPRASE